MKRDRSHMRAGALRQRGQAMVELIVGAMLLVPLFIGIVILARYIDIKSTTVQASRYAAFERATNLGRFSDAELERKMRERLFTLSDAPVRSSDGLGNGDAWRNENPNFMDHSSRANRLIARPADVTLRTSEASAPGAAGTGAEAVANAIDGIGRVTGSRFDVNRRAFYTGTVSVKLANLSALPAPLNNLDLTLSDRTTLLGDTWHAGSPAAVAQRTGALVPSRLFEPVNRLLRPVRGALSIFEPAFEELCLGQIDPEIVPNDRLGPAGSGDRGSFRPSC
jgi:hypothetical protein